MDSEKGSGTTRDSEKERGSIESGWESIIKTLLVKIETVSSHFRYTEEYVMDHSPEWLSRKYWQALKEKWEDSQSRVLEGFKSVALFADSVFNKGKNYDMFIHNSFEEAMKTNLEEPKKDYSKFETGQWWLVTERKKSSE
jgi:hypothetical protein